MQTNMIAAPVLLILAMITGPGTASESADPVLLSKLNAAATVEEVRSIVGNVGPGDALEALLDEMDNTALAGPIIEKLEKDARARAVAGEYRACDVFFPETGPMFPDAISDTEYLTMSVEEIAGGSGMLLTSSEFDHDVISMMTVSDAGLTDAIHMYASQNIHRIKTELHVHGSVIENDGDKFHRATFLILKDVGLLYLRGDGRVRSDDGNAIELAGRTCS